MSAAAAGTGAGTGIHPGPPPVRPPAEAEAEAEAEAVRPRADTDAVDLWLLPEDAVDYFSDRLGGPELLTPEERARMHRMRVPAARRRFLGARLLSRHALSARTGLPPGRWRFAAGPDGRPEPEPAPGGVRFNLSHTDGLVACVVTRQRDCGVDVERTPARTAAAARLPHYFAPAEQAAVEAAPPGRRAERVAAYWVLKEAYVKALGTGLRRAPESFAFSPPHRPPIEVTDPQAPPDARWRFVLLRPTPGHVLAVAVGGVTEGPLHLTVHPFCAPPAAAALPLARSHVRSARAAHHSRDRHV